MPEKNGPGSLAFYLRGGSRVVCPVRTSVDVARVYSSSDIGNLADATKKSTFFQPSTNPAKPTYLPQIRTTLIRRST
jgi:hypothetical protein